jgi:hypothetical protein
VAEVDAARVAAVLAADADLEVLAGGAALLDGHLDQLADAGLVERWNGSFGRIPMLDVVAAGSPSRRRG